MTKKIIASCVSFLLALNFIAAQEEGVQNNEAEKEQPEVVVLTVDQAVEYALENNRDIKSLNINLAMQERVAKYSWNVLLPDVTLRGTAARTTNIESSVFNLKKLPGFEESEKHHWALVGNLNAQLNLSLAYIYNIKAAKTGYEGGKISWEQTQKQIIMGVKKMFYGLLLQQENLKLEKTTLENAKQRAEQAEVNYRNGRLPEVQLVKAQVDYANQQPVYETAEQDYNQQLDMLAIMLGLPVGTKIELTGSIEPVYVNVITESLLENYSEKNLSIQSIQSEIDKMNLQLKAANLGSYTPALVFSYGLNPTGSWLYGYGVGDYSGDLKWADMGSLSITLAFNITDMLPFSKGRQQAQDLKDGISASKLKLEKEKETQKANVRKAVDTLNQAREQIESMERTVDLAQRSYDMSLRMYNNGMMERLDLIDAETGLNKAKLGQLNQKFQYISALMDLEYELNTDLSEYKE